jgi:plastocyanin domain-containing protein
MNSKRGARMMKNIPITVLFISLFIFSAVALAKSPGMRKEQLVTMEVTGAGFVPAEIKVKAKQPVRLVVTRKTDRTCAKEIVLKEFNINHPLPLNQPTEVKFTPPKPGSYRYACGMDMIAGVLIVE